MAVDPERIAEDLDIKAESLATLLAYMHLRQDAKPALTLLPPAPMVSA